MSLTLLSLLLMGMLPVAGSSVPRLPEPLRSLSIVAPSARDSLASLQQPESPLTASGVIVLDANTGQEVYSHHPDEIRPIGSLAKLMTALLVVEHDDLHELVTIPPIAAEVEGNTAKLPVGQQFTVGDLLSALLIASANDAAEALAVFHSGSVDAFVAEMNARTTALGLTHTSFGHPAGFDVGDSGSTPRELGWLLLAALRHDAIRTRLGQKSALIHSRQGQPISLIHTHALLHRNGLPPGAGNLLAGLQSLGFHEKPIVIAGKTGTTPRAMQCLVSVVARGSREYIVVILGSQQRYDDLSVILESFTGSLL